MTFISFDRSFHSRIWEHSLAVSEPIIKIPHYKGMDEKITKIHMGLRALFLSLFSNWSPADVRGWCTIEHEHFGSSWFFYTTSL